MRWVGFDKWEITYGGRAFLGNVEYHAAIMVEWFFQPKAEGRAGREARAFFKKPASTGTPALIKLRIKYLCWRWRPEKISSTQKEKCWVLYWTSRVWLPAAYGPFITLKYRQRKQQFWTHFPTRELGFSLVVISPLHHNEYFEYHFINRFFFWVISTCVL